MINDNVEIRERREMAIRSIVGLKDHYHPDRVLYKEEDVRRATSYIDSIRNFIRREIKVDLGEPEITSGTQGSVWLTWEDGETDKGDYWFMVNVLNDGRLDTQGRFFRGGDIIHPKLKIVNN